MLRDRHTCFQHAVLSTVISASVYLQLPFGVGNDTRHSLHSQYL